MPEGVRHRVETLGAAYYVTSVSDLPELCIQCERGQYDTKGPFELGSGRDTPIRLV
jgi:hypothetical protein